MDSFFGTIFGGRYYSMNGLKGNPRSNPATEKKPTQQEDIQGGQPL